PTMKLVALVPAPAGLSAWIGPVVAPAGTVAVICVLELTVKLALAPLKVTPVVPRKFRPVIATLVPTAPPPGEKLPICGAKLAARFQFRTTVPEAATALGWPSPASPRAPSTAI